MDERYKIFESAITGKQWRRLGIRRRAGVAVPLFSLYSKKSAGIGEIPDLKLLIEWCQQAGLSIIQLLPMNDVGFDFTPYDAKSTFALEPMYLRLEELSGADTAPFQERIEKLRRDFPTGTPRVNYRVKKHKLDLLWEIFSSAKQESAEFRKYREASGWWLRDYALYQTAKEVSEMRAWFDWEPGLRNRQPAALAALEKANGRRIEFYEWLQWQLFEQFRAVRSAAQKAGIFFMGDLPFLVSRDSADVWAHQEYFKLNLLSGAPPDMYFAQGQRWGMPPYQWANMERRGYDYLIQKLGYAQNFYDFFRIDHVVGIFRVWTIAQDEPEESAGLKGRFDPEPEQEWEGHGRKLLSLMIENTVMLPCAEDLGTVPDCSYRVLAEFAIPGTDVQRWAKHWKGDFDFMKPEEYRPNSVAVAATHDSSNLQGWWEYEAGTVDEELFKRKCNERGIDFAAIRPRLADEAKSHYGRLRWREELRTADDLLAVLGRPLDQVRDLAELFLGSIGEKQKFWQYAGFTGQAKEMADKGIIRAALEKASETASIFSIQLLQDWLLLDQLRNDSWEYRINFPGTLNEKNWSLTAPMALEKMKKLAVNAEIKSINGRTGRLAETVNPVAGSHARRQPAGTEAKNKRRSAA